MKNSSVEKGRILWEWCRYGVVFEDSVVVRVIGWFVVGKGGERVDGSTSKDVG